MLVILALVAIIFALSIGHIEKKEVTLSTPISTSVSGDGLTVYEIVSYRANYSLLVCPTGRVSKIWMPYIQAWNAQSNVSIVKISPEFSDIYIDPNNGNKVIYWEVLIDHPMLFSQIFEFTTFNGIWNINETKIGEYIESDPNYVEYTSPEERIESSHPAIKNAARKIVGDETNPLEKARLIYDFVSGLDLKYEEGRVKQDALNAYTTGYGDCGDYAYLFVALCRAEGIPSRIVAGTHAIGSEEWDFKYTHLWAEFYLPNYGWITVDPTRQNYFAKITNDRLIFSKGSTSIKEKNIEMPWFHMVYVDGTQCEEGCGCLTLDAISKTVETI